MRGKFVWALILAFISVLLLAALMSQATLITAISPTTPSIEWEQQYSTGSIIRAMTLTSDGGYALAGSAMSIVIGAVGPWLIKVDSSGDKQWEKFYFAEKMNVNLGGADSIVQAPDGGYALVGSSYLVKSDSQGIFQWRQNYSDTSISSLIKKNENGYILAGSENGAPWLAAVDLTGHIIWSQTYEGKDGMVMSLVQTSNGGYAAAGFMNNSALLMKIDDLGNLLWNQIYDRTQSAAYSLIQVDDAGFLLAGSVNNTVLLIKTDLNGKMVWNQTYDTGAAWSVIQTADGGYALGCGNFDSGSLIKTDSAGNLLWHLSLNSTAYSVIQAGDGGFVLAGGNGVGNNWLIELAPASTILPQHLPFQNYLGW